MTETIFEVTTTRQDYRVREHIEKLPLRGLYAYLGALTMEFEESKRLDASVIEFSGKYQSAGGDYLPHSASVHFERIEL